MNYNINAGALLDDFSSLTGWSDYGSTGSVTVDLDTTNTRTGTAGLRLSQSDDTATRVVARQKSIGPHDLSGIEYFDIAVYFPDGLVSGNNIALYLASGGSFANSKVVTIGGSVTGTAKPGWNHWRFPKSSFSTVGGTLDWSAVNLMMVKFNTFSAADSVTIDALYAGVRARPKVLLTMDDTASSQLAAVQYANSKNVPVTLYAIKDYAEDHETYPGYLTESEIQSLAAAGNAIGIHHQENLTGLPLATVEQHVQDCMTWLQNLGVSRGYNHVSWPEGEWSEGLLSAAASLGIKSGVSIRGFGVTAYSHENHSIGLANSYNVNRMPLNGTTLAQAQAAVDTAIAAGESVIFYVHTIGASAEWATADWEDLCDYIQAKVQAGEIDAVTIDQWHSGLAGNGSRAAIGHPGRVKYTPTIVTADPLVIKLPAAPELIEILGLDSAYYDAAGVPKNITWATHVDNLKVRLGNDADLPRGVIYSVDQDAATITRIDRYIRNS